MDSESTISLGAGRNIDNPENDLLTIRKYQEKGNTAILSPLFMKYNSMILGVCMKYVKDLELSKDLTMDIFEKLVKDLKNQKIENFRSWLYVLVKNQCLMHLRKEKKKAAGLEELEKNSSMLMENHLDWHPFNSDQEGVTRMILKKCLERLERGQKESINMFYLDRKTYQEISEYMQIELKAVKSNLQNGRRNLKICMDRKLKRMQEV